MNIRTLALCTTVALAPGAYLATAQTATVTEPATFAAMAASSDMFEISSSQLALEMSGEEQVQVFAQEMIEDHTQASANLMAAAEMDGVAPPTEMMEKHRVQLEQLEAAGPDMFDQAYLAAQITAHDEAVTLFSTFSEQGEESELREFAAETLPVLQEHLAHVQELAGS